MPTDSREPFHIGMITANYLNTYFAKEQGVRLGESAVVSLKAHQVRPRQKGVVRILVNCDAGQTYLDYLEPGEVVHLDVFHGPGELSLKDLARHMTWAIEDYILAEDQRLKYADDERANAIIELALKIHIATRQGKGMLYDIMQGLIEPPGEEDEGMTWIRVLMKLKNDRYGLILPIAQAVEDSLIENGVKLGKVKRIMHVKEKPPDEDFASYLVFPWKKLKNLNRQTKMANQNQLMMKLAEKFGSLEELEEFLKDYSSGIIGRKSMEEQKRRWGNMQHYLDQMKELEIIKEGLWGMRLTRDGKEIRDYLALHRCELEAEIRRSIRRTEKSRPGRFRQVGEAKQRRTTVEFTNRNKVIRLKDAPWPGDLAVFETVIAAKKASLLKQKRHISISKDEIYIYGKRTYVPLNICLLIDASFSMSGEKRQAAFYLAEHLLLTSRDKIAVVTFQNKQGRVVVPFTRDHKVLTKGLAEISPGGTTPLAGGIMTSVELIKASRVENPMLFLITDGLPNVGLWSTNATADALLAAQKIAQGKIRFICIGVEANQDFLRELAEAGRGKLYVVDDLNKGNLIEIARSERKHVKISRNH